MEPRVAHQKRCEQREDYDQAVKHGYTARLVEVILAEKAKVNRERNDDYEHIERLAGRGHAYLARVAAAPLVFLLERVENAVHLLVDDASAVNDFLSLLNHAHGQWYSVHEVVERSATLLPVVNHVGRDVVVEVAFLQYLPVLFERLVDEQALVGGLRSIQRVEPHADGALAAYYAYGARSVGVELLVVGRAYYSPPVESVQPVGYNAYVVVAEPGNPVAEVGHKLAHLLPLGVAVQPVVWLIGAQYAVALLPYGLLRLVYREVERRREVAILPRLALLHAEIVAAVVGHGPHRYGHGADDDSSTHEYVAPRYVFPIVECAHKP